jgi:hypothetical protein
MCAHQKKRKTTEIVKHLEIQKYILMINVSLKKSGRFKYFWKQMEI